MSFTLEKSITAKQVTPDGVGIGESIAVATLTYTVDKVQLEGAQGIIFYTVTSSLDEKGVSNYITFQYSESGPVMEEAESALRAHAEGGS